MRNLKEAIVITRGVNQVRDYHEKIGEKNWYEENFGGHYPVGPHMSYNHEWFWYYCPSSNERHGSSGIGSLVNTLTRHPGVPVYTCDQFLKEKLITK